MKFKKPAHQSTPFPPFRKLTMDAVRMGLKRPMIQGMIELDITESRQRLKAYQKQNRKSVSLTSYVIHCIGLAVASHQQMHGILDWRRRLILFEDVDLCLPIEVDFGEYQYPVFHILRSVNKRSVWEIDEEIQNFLSDPQLIPSLKKSWKGIRWFFFFPFFIRKGIYRALLKNPFLVKKWLGTVAVTAIGMFGAQGGWGIGISNHPLEIILGGVSKKVVQVKGKMENRYMMHVTISVDHDIIDGAPGARFVKDLRRLVEKGEGLQEE